MSRKNLPLLEKLKAEPEGSGQSKLVRALGSPDFHTRAKAVGGLTRFLQKRAGQLSEKNMMKIWKGLFYAFWHSDKTPVQTELAERLAAVTINLEADMSFQYFSCFIKTMRREWLGIDRLRLDKFLMLIRKFTSKSLEFLCHHKWQIDLVKKLSFLLQDKVFFPSDRHRALGITYHLCDLFLPELKGVVSTSQNNRQEPPGDLALRQLLEPFCQLLIQISDEPALNRIRSSFFDPLIEEICSPSDGKPLSCLSMKDLASHLFDAGAKEDTPYRNRTLLYSLSDALERALSRKMKQQQKIQGGIEKEKAATSEEKKVEESRDVEEKQEKKRKRDAVLTEAKIESQPQEKESISAASPQGSVDQSQGKHAKKAKLITIQAPSTEQAKKEPHSAKSALKRAPAAQEEAHTPPSKLKGGAAKEESKAAPPPPSSKKKVKIVLERNLVFEVGSKPAPPEIRTPSRAKGSILKRSTNAPASAPPKIISNAPASHRKYNAPASHRKYKGRRGSLGGNGNGNTRPGMLFF